jgi:cytoskeletal protein CcmA (bactofilin family)
MGKFDGQILSGAELVVGESAIVNTETKVGTIIVNGDVNEDVTTKAKIEIRSTGKVHGNINTPAPVIEEGAVFDQTCKITMTLTPEN